MGDSVLASNLFSVQGKVALVTGGGTGIGKMIAKSFVRNGAKVYIASRNKETLDGVAAELTAMGPGKCIGIPANLTTKDACDALAAEIERREGGKLHILVNNSGATWGSPINKVPESSWRRVFDLNVTGSFYLTIACMPLLKKASAGFSDPARVILITSVAGIVPSDVPSLMAAGVTALPYNTSKAAANYLTRSLSFYFAEHGVTVNAIAPGIFPTTAMAKSLENDLNTQFTPLARFGAETDMAGAALFLASPAGAFVTGVVLPVDGGSSVGKPSNIVPKLKSKI